MDTIIERNAKMTKHIFILLILVLSIFADACEYRTRDGTCYGKDVREKFFYFADKFINFNHGSLKNRPSSFLNRRHTQTLGFESKCMILFMIAEP